MYDEGGIRLGPAEFVLFGTDWLPDCDLSYSFTNFTPDLTNAQVRAAVVSGLGLWAAPTGLTFTEVADNGTAPDDPSAEEPNAGNIRILFAAGNHGDGFAFDGTGSVLAHAFLDTHWWWLSVYFRGRDC